MNGFVTHDVSAAESGCPASFVGRPFRGCPIRRNSSGQPCLALLAACALVAVGTSLPPARGGQPSFVFGEGVASVGDDGAPPTFESVLLSSPSGRPSESVITDGASPGDGFLAADASRTARNEEQTAHLQPGLLHFVRPQIPTAQQGSIHIAWHPIDPPAFIRACLLPV